MNKKKEWQSILLDLGLLLLLFIIFNFQFIKKILNNYLIKIIEKNIFLKILNKLIKNLFSIIIIIFCIFWSYFKKNKYKIQ